MFKFGFVSDQLSAQCYSNDEEKATNLKWLPCKEILIQDVKRNEDNQPNEVESVNVGDEILLYIKPSIILHRIKENKNSAEEIICIAEENHSDLIPSKYEGGLKVWECTYDIAKYLDNTQLNDKTMLDLGCGVGLLGILGLKLGAASVHFQDYNDDVLRYATIPNVELNADPNQLSACRFFSGDWESFADLSESTYDVVVSSETIYNPENYLKLHNTIQKLLKPTGIVLLGAKSYYFGVGGSTRQFEKLVLARDVFNIEVVWKCSEGVQREILKLTFKNSKS